MRSVEQLQPLPDVATRLGVTTRTVMAWTKAGQLPPSIRIGRNTYYPPNTVENYLENKLTNQ